MICDELLADTGVALTPPEVNGSMLLTWMLVLGLERLVVMVGVVPAVPFGNALRVSTTATE